MLLGTLLLGIVGNVELHELVETSESVAKGGVFDPLLVSYNEVVQSQERLDRVYKEVPVAWDGADWVTEQGQVHDLRQGHERLQVVPIANVVVMQVEELQIAQACKHLGRWQSGQRVVAQVDLLEGLERVQVHQVSLQQDVALQVSDRKVVALGKHLEAAGDSEISATDNSDLAETVTFGEP